MKKPKKLPVIGKKQKKPKSKIVSKTERNIQRKQTVRQQIINKVDRFKAIKIRVIQLKKELIELKQRPNSIKDWGWFIKKIQQEIKFLENEKSSLKKLTRQKAIIKRLRVFGMNKITRTKLEAEKGYKQQLEKLEKEFWKRE